MCTYGSRPVERPGIVIAGRYKLLEQLGEGGMGTVWVAEQIQPVRRKVALKVIKPGMDSRIVLSRFEQERQALALMDHPNIAKVLDAGVTGGEAHELQSMGLGRPFLSWNTSKGCRSPILRQCPVDRPRTAGIVRAGLAQGRANARPKRDHPPRFEAIQRPSLPLRR